MASAMDQVTQGTMRISGLIHKIADASEKTAKASEGVSNQAREMRSRGEELLSQIRHFKVRESGSVAVHRNGGKRLPAGPR
jgi:methyl-accepting chemotaxis protein